MKTICWRKLSAPLFNEYFILHDDASETIDRKRASRVRCKNYLHVCFEKLITMRYFFRSQAQGCECMGIIYWFRDDYRANDKVLMNKFLTTSLANWRASTCCFAGVFIGLNFHTSLAQFGALSKNRKHFLGKLQWNSH